MGPVTRSPFGVQRNSAPSRGHLTSTLSKDSPPATEEKFDAESGLQYTEATVCVGRGRTADWIGEPRTPSLIPRTKPNARGARSLAEMARLRVIQQMRNLTPEHFEVVPWLTSEGIWDQTVALYLCLLLYATLLLIRAQTRRVIPCLEDTSSSLPSTGRVRRSRPSLPAGNQAANSATTGLYQWHQLPHSHMAVMLAGVPKAIVDSRLGVITCHHESRCIGPFRQPQLDR
jgi:hypothetical protein